MRVEKLLKRLRREFIKVNLIQAALDSIIIFLTANLALFLLNVKIISNTVHYRVLTGLTVLFLLADWIYRSRKYRLEIYEENNPQLREILRTARDNLDTQNIVSQAMFDDLIKRARSVTSESIIPGTEIIQKIVLIGVLSFLTAISGIANVQIQEETKQIFSQLNPQDFLQEDTQELRNGSEIYGEPQDIEASSTNLQINVTGDATGQQEENMLRRLESEQFTFETANPELPEDIELAKNYSLEIRQLQ